MASAFPDGVALLRHWFLRAAGLGEQRDTVAPLRAGGCKFLWVAHGPPKKRENLIRVGPRVLRP